MNTYINFDHYKLLYGNKNMAPVLTLWSDYQSSRNLDCTNGINTQKVNRTNINSQLPAITFTVHIETVVAHSYLLNTARSHVYNNLSEYPWFTRAPAFCHETLPSSQKKRIIFYVALDIQTFTSVILYCHIGLFYDRGCDAFSRSVCSVKIGRR
jgi:hypothetical protein